jgi:peptide deformylase
VREIVYYPDRILRLKTDEVKTVDKELLADIRDLKAVLMDYQERAAGLAAVQIGLPRRFFGLLGGNKKVVKIYINPKIEKNYGEKVRPIMVFADGTQEGLLEGCLSFPEFFGEVKRYLKIEVSWDEIEAEKLVRKYGEFNGMEAIAFQHESEHLDGILFVDHVKEEDGKIYKWAKGERKILWSVDKIISGR